MRRPIRVLERTRTAMIRIAIFLCVTSACGGGDAAPVLDAEPTPPDATFVCDLLEQDCGDGDKSTIAPPSRGAPLEATCTPVTGSVAEGDACTRDPVLGLGHDDCAVGLLCAFIRVLPPANGGTRRCRAQCYASTDCPDGQRCAQHTDDPEGGFAARPARRSRPERTA